MNLDGNERGFGLRVGMKANGRRCLVDGRPVCKAKANQCSQSRSRSSAYHAKEDGPAHNFTRISAFSSERTAPIGQGGSTDGASRQADQSTD